MKQVYKQITIKMMAMLGDLAFADCVDQVAKYAIKNKRKGLIAKLFFSIFLLDSSSPYKLKM
jgi:hypothetical protein